MLKPSANGRARDYFWGARAKTAQACFAAAALGGLLRELWLPRTLGCGFVAPTPPPVGFRHPASLVSHPASRRQQATAQPARLSLNITLLPANTPLQSRNPSGPFCCFDPFLRVRLASDGSYTALPFPILDPLDPLGAVSTAIRIIPLLFVQNTNPGLSRHATSSLSTSVGAGHSTINDLATQVCDGRFHSAILSGQTR